MAKLKSFDTERLIKEIEWFSDKKIDLVYNADANYGILKRDIELTEKMAEIKARTGFPNKFRAAYAKNSNDTVFQIAHILHKANMNKGVTLSFQSMNNNTLELIKRKNIKIENFKEIIQRYRKHDIATYSEIIIGLPGESYHSFAEGLNTLVSSGQHSSLSIYTCELLPNSEMNQPDYRELHKIKSVKTPVLFFHGTPAVDPYREYYEMVIGNSTLSEEDWMKCQHISWAFQAFHCLGLLQLISLYLYTKYGISYRDVYESVLEYALKRPDSVLGRAKSRSDECFNNLRNGLEWGFVDAKFGDIIWPPEEAGFLTCIAQKDAFYQEIREWLSIFEKDSILADDLTKYQSSMLWSTFQAEETVFLRYNLHEYLQAAYMNEKVDLIASPVSYKIKPSKTYVNLENYAREVVWYGRKGGKFHNEVIS